MSAFNRIDQEPQNWMHTVFVKAAVMLGFEMITAGVGEGQPNVFEDVLLVQRLMNKKNFDGQMQLKEDGDCGKRTLTMIRVLQSFLKTPVDGWIGPSGKTFRYLKTFHYLETSGPGYKVYGGSSDQAKRLYGTESVISNIKSISKEFFNSQSHIAVDKKALLQVGDISYLDGHEMPPHVSHRKGTDVDFRPIRKDGKATGVNISDKEYDHERTKKLISIIRTYPVERILFNDTAIEGVMRYKGHNNHIHVRFGL